MDQCEFLYGMAMPKRDFTCIRLLLQQSLISKIVEFDDYISCIVRDAKAVAESSSNIATINRDLYYYSVYLGEKGKSWILDVNPNNISVEDYKKILKVFEMP